MRPVRLEAEGFTAFRGPTVVDFSGVELFALVGPTGAGKTSVIDALTFALYGSVPRLDDRRAVAPVISQNLNEARVRLDFTVEGVPHTAVRVVRATKAGATTREARLECRGEVVAGTADEVTAAVTERLGLTFEHFTTCVSLPQGQFARFLHDKPRSRQDLLVRLLELGLYDQVASAARQRSTSARSRADAVASQLERLADATPEARDTAARRVGELAALGERLAGAKPALDELAARAVEADERRQVVAGQADRMAALVAPAGIDELAAGLIAAEAARRRALAQDDDAAAALVAAEDRLARLPERALLDGLLADHRRRDELSDTVLRGEKAEAEAATRLSDAGAADERARQAQAAARRHLDTVRVELRAQALVPELAEGEPCPVCRQVVEALPGGHHPPDLAEAERALARAEAAAAAAGDELADARAHAARVDEKLTTVRRDLAAVDATLVASSRRLRPLLAPVGGAGSVGRADPGADGTGRGGAEGAARAGDDPGSGDDEGAAGDQGRPVGDGDVAGGPGGGAGDPGGPGGAGGSAGNGVVEPGEVAAQLEVVEAAEAALRAARVAEREARRARAEADRRHAELVDAERDARRAFDTARDAVASLSPPPAERRDLAADWAGLLTWAAERRPALLDEAEQHARAAQAARSEAAGQLTELTGACRAAGVEARTGAWPGEAVAAAHARAEEAVAALEARIAEAGRLRDEVRSATEEYQVADALAGHLRADHFEKWLLDEALHQLVEGASVILGELSAGTYALGVDTRTGGFLVVDHANASQARPARTLSGGETFLASLALALALADQVAGLAVAGTARLEALFLDEGFGTLDPDTLDVVAGALDELGARGRMVGVVTHVRELADRLPVRFEVRKVGGAAAVERVEA